MSAAPWFEPPAPPLRPGDRAVVVGAGLAGAHCAYYLALRGIDVTVLERASQVAAEASGNPAGVLLPFLSRGKDDSSRFLDQAYGFACHSLATTPQWRNPVCDRVVQLVDQPRLRRFHDALTFAPQPFVTALNPTETARIVGLALRQPSLLLQRARALDPAALCRDRLCHANIDVRLNCAVEQIVPEQDGWSLWGAGGLLAHAQVVVLANAQAATSFEQLRGFPLGGNPGQLVLVEERRLRKLPKAVVCHHEYLVPGVAGQLLVGASWREAQAGLELSAVEQAQLLQGADELLPELGLPQELPLCGRVGLRASTPDHLPLVGALPDLTRYCAAYEELHQGRCNDWQPAPCHPGLYVSLGHGARGLLTTPLAGWLLAALIVDGPPPDQHLLAAVHPGRYAMRQLRRHPSHRKSDNL